MMTRRSDSFVLTLLMALALMAGCGKGSLFPQLGEDGRGLPQALVLADSLMNSRPDSALAVLEGAEGEMAGESRAVRMRYQLLLADAHNKCYVDFTTDSLMLDVAEYYDHYGTAYDRMRAHYLLGCTYRDMSEAPQALQCYQDAVELADTTNHEHLRMLMKIYSQMAELYHAQNLPQDELDCRLSNQRYAFLLGDTLSYIRHCELMIKPYFLLGDTSNIILTLEKVRQLYLEHNAPDKAAATCNTLIDFYSSLGRLREARQLMDEFEQRSGLFDKSGRIEKGREIYYYIKGNYFLHLHQLDSAEHYFRRLQRECRSLNDTLGIYKGMMELYQQRRIIDSTVYYSRLYTVALDRQSNERQTETVHRMTKLYSYNRLQQQAAADHLAAVRTRFLLITFLIIGLLALSLLMWYWRQEKRKRQQAYEAYQANCDALDKQTEEVLQLKQHEEEYKSLIAEKEQRISNLEQKISDFQHLQNPLSSEITENPIFIAFKRNAICGEMPSDDEWQQLLNLVETHLPKFNQFLSQWESHLTENEYKLCVMVRLHVAPSSIAAMLQVTPPYINKLRIKLLGLLFNTKGKAAEFDMRIQRMR